MLSMWIRNNRRGRLRLPFERQAAGPSVSAGSFEIAS